MDKNEKVAALLKSRWIAPADADVVAGWERKLHEYTDPDFDVPMTREYAWSAKDIVEVMTKKHASKSGTWPVRGRVVHADGDTAALGGVIFELREDSYHVLLLTAEPGHVNARLAALNFLLLRAGHSERRNKVAFTVPDGDYENLRLLKQAEFAVRIAADGERWECERAVPKGWPAGQAANVAS